MAWYEDLSECDYFGIEFSSHIRPVGWLERGTAFSVGEVDGAVFSKLIQLGRNPWQPAIAAGVHDCDLCLYEAEAHGGNNIIIPGETFAYVCPELIVHYMNAHRYSPPSSFCSAVLGCPPMRSKAYLEALLKCARPLVQHVGQ